MAATTFEETRIYQELIEAFGVFFERFGFKRNFGRVWMFLYLSPDPLDQATIGSELELSSGLVSSTLKQLGHWGAVRSEVVPHSKKRLYHAEEHLLRTVVSILRKREAPAVRQIMDVVGQALQVIGPAGRGAARLRVKRLKNIQRIAHLYQVLVGFVERLSQGPSSFMQLGAQVVSRLTFGRRDSSSN